MYTALYKLIYIFHSGTYLILATEWKIYAVKAGKSWEELIEGSSEFLRLQSAVKLIQIQLVVYECYPTLSSNT